MHQLSAFSNNQSYQQSPPNIRSKGAVHHGPGGGQNMQGNKLNNLFEKNKTSATLNIKMNNNGQAGKNQAGLFINGLNAGNNLQTINGQS